VNSYAKHLILDKALIKEALAKLNNLAVDSILFVVDDGGVLVGSLTDGDVRRGFLGGLNFENRITDFLQPNPKFIIKGQYSIETIIGLREKNFRIIPVVDAQKRILNVINFRIQKSYLPIDAVIMAGGRGERLKPLTDTTPKPMLTVGDKPIIEHNVDRLMSFGVDDFWISVRYLGAQVKNFLGNGNSKNVTIKYVDETEPLGTIGAVSRIEEFVHDTILVMNSDILTNVDFEDFFLEFVAADADLSVVTIPYEVSIPYAVLETSNGHVLSFKEKPTYTYYSNGGIYLIKRSALENIPANSFFNATDLVERLINSGRKVHSYPLHGYWLDIGRMEDYAKAQRDIHHVKF
jgi:dTDP-glucose pyrophosphorylase